MPEPFPQKDHSISLEQAVVMTRRFRENKEKILAPGIPSDTIANAETFSKDAIVKLLDHAAAANFRIYYGMDDALKIHAILVAVDAEGNDLLPKAVAAADEDDYEIVEEGERCPPFCSDESPLNHD